MYKLLIHTNDKSDFGIFTANQEYYLKTSDEVCEVFKVLSGLKCAFNLVQISFSAIDDIRRDFKLIPDNEKEKENKDELP